MNFLNRVKQAAEQVSHQIRDVINSPIGPVVSRAQTQQLYNSESPRDVLVSLVHSVCGVIDQYAISDNADTMEGDRVLYESNAREYLRKIIELLVADGGRWMECISEGSSAGSSDVELECIDAFLQTNAMHELCRRAGRDLPRGCLPMILSFTSSLLRQVRYPLLPHQTIYKPLTKLLSITCRFDAVLGRGGELSLEAANYARRVDTALCNLLGTLWRKIAENPAVLDFFFHEDTRMGGSGSGGGSGGAHRLAPQMDVLSALLPLVQRPRVGQLARDALLVALSIRDVRVDAFLVHHTSLLREVADSLGQQFAAATVPVVAPVQAAKALLPLPLLLSEGKAAGISLPGSIGAHVQSPVQSPAPGRSDSRAGPVEAFLRTLRLVCLIVVAASPQPNLTLLVPPSLEQRGSAHSVRAAACEAYCRGFLEGSLRVLLGDMGDELASVSATSLLRYVLRELELFRQDCPLLGLTVRFLLGLPGGDDAAPAKTTANCDNVHGKKPHTGGECRHSDFICGLVLRCSSMFPQVSLASTQLVSALLQLSSLEEAFLLLAKGTDQADESDNPAPSTPTPSSLQQQLDVRVNNACKALAAKASPGAAPLPPPAASWLAAAYVSAPYIDAAAHEVLARLARRSALPLSSAPAPPSTSPPRDRASPGAGLSEYLPGSFSLCDVSEFLQRDWAADDGSAILGLVRRRLGCFLSLKLDEQVATAGLVSQVLALFCTAVVSATEVDNAQGGRCLDYLLEALRLLEGLWAEVARHLADVPGLEAKAAAMQHLLHASAKGDPPDAQCVKLFEREPVRTVRVLETALVLRELIAQAGGYLHAAERLRVALTDPAGPFAQPSVPRTLHPATDSDEDEWDCDHHETNAGLFPSIADVEAAFERDFQEALKSLDAVVAK